MYVFGAKVNELALFAGAGGGILGGKLLGWRTVCAVEWEPYPASVLCARQNDGLLPPFPIWDDIQTFDGKPWRGIVDVVSGGFPCQDISAAGKGDGLDGERSGMWRHMARVVGEVRPRFVFVENSPMLTTRGGTRVIGDLTALGYDCRWTVMGAADVGANHQRDRIWIVAHSKSAGNRRELRGLYRTNETQRQSEKYGQNATTKFDDGSQDVGKSKCSGLEGQRIQPRQSQISQSGNSGSLAYADSMRELQPQGRKQDQWGWIGDKGWWKVEPNVGRVADGVAARVDRLKAIGNGQVPLCAATAWKLLTK